MTTQKPTGPNAIIALWEKSRIELTDKYTASQEMIQIGDSVIGTLGNFSVSIGKPKSKKTFNVSAMVAAALKNGVCLQYVVNLPKDKRKVLFIDTEQSPYHCHKVMQRIAKMAGLPLNEKPDNLEFLSLRRYHTDERTAIIEAAIYGTDNLGLVVIDGIRDMVKDINSPGEATGIISNLMKWTDERQIHIHTIVHQNKADVNARGHLGTELSNKAETMLEIKKCTTNSNISIVTAVHTRALEFQPFAFQINSDALPELVGNYSSITSKNTSKSIDYSEMTDEQHMEVLEQVFSENDSYGYDDLIQAFKNAYTAKGYRFNSKMKQVKKHIEEKGMILIEGKNYYLNHDYFDS